MVGRGWPARESTSARRVSTVKSRMWGVSLVDLAIPATLEAAVPVRARCQEWVQASTASGRYTLAHQSSAGKESASTEASRAVRRREVMAAIYRRGSGFV